MPGAKVTSPADAPTDAQLIDRVRANDAAAFAELRRRHRTDATRIARTVAHDPAEAERVAGEAFERLHAALVAGAGPRASVSPYLRTMIRRGALDAHRSPGDGHEPVDPAAVEDLPYSTDPVTTVEDRNVIREAYESLPERWQRALWFTEIEGRTPASLVPGLGSSATSVAAMAYRAREGLRQAYLAVHMSVAVSAACRPIVANLPAYARRALQPQDDVAVATHLNSCVECRNRRYELTLLVSNLRSVLAPALLGHRAGIPAAGVAVAAGLARTPATASMAIVSRLPRRTVKVAASATVGVLAVAALALAASSAFAPTTSVDTAGDDGDPPTVTSGRTDEPPPAVTIDPLDRLDGEPVEDDDGPAEDTDGQSEQPDTGSAASDEAGAGGSEPRAGADAGPAGGDETAPADSGGDKTAAADSGTNTSGSEPAGASTTAPVGGGAAVGGDSAESGAGNNGNNPPRRGSGSDPSDRSGPSTGNDGDSDGDADEPTEPDEAPDKEDRDEPRLVDRVLCFILC